MALRWEPAAGFPSPSTCPARLQSSTVLDSASASVYHAAPALASESGRGSAFGRGSPDPGSGTLSHSSDSETDCTTARHPLTRPHLRARLRLSEPSMPTVPPAFVPVAVYDHAVAPVPGPAPFPIDPLLDQERDDTGSGPTPDPDVEDFAVVHMDNGNAVTEVSTKSLLIRPAPSGWVDRRRRRIRPLLC